MQQLTLLLLSLLIACQFSKDNQLQENTNTLPSYPAALTNALTAHGGLSRWQKMKTLTYRLHKDDSATAELHTVSLSDRKVLIEKPRHTIGFDGEQVWITPGLEGFNGSPRFYHNLYFYFFSIPFVLADPGIHYDPLGLILFNGKSYQGLKISYAPDIGDSPGDSYIVYFDPETHILEWVLYTVTYFSRERHQNYNALHYQDWVNINGFQFPTRLTGHVYKNDSVKSIRYEAHFSAIEILESSTDSNRFHVPPGATIDSLKH